MARSDPWQGVATVIQMAAVIGAGVGAASALMYARRHAAIQEVEFDALERRIRSLERLGDRVARLEARVEQTGAAERDRHA